ncbi:MAG TPA: hypothetical protein PLK58_13530 [Candidatus Rifleibacterium sp.]|nr:hypothetical protein [Candidatus Rifleibacterium sp.]
MQRLQNQSLFNIAYRTRCLVQLNDSGLANTSLGVNENAFQGLGLQTSQRAKPFKSINQFMTVVCPQADNRTHLTECFYRLQHASVGASIDYAQGTIGFANLRKIKLVYFIAHVQSVIRPHKAGELVISLQSTPPENCRRYIPESAC